MSVNLFEAALQPVVNLDTDIVVYVPGYAVKGPGEPTLVNSSSFTALFGEEPYKFKTIQDTTIPKNNTFATRPDKSWLYAKGLVDAGLTVLYHRVNPHNIGKASTTIDCFTLKGAEGSATLAALDPAKAFSAQAKYFGMFYTDLTVSFTPSQPGGNTTVKVKRGVDTLETVVVSFNPAKNNYIGNINFKYVDFFTGDPDSGTQQIGFENLQLAAWLSETENAGKSLYVEANAAPLYLTPPEVGGTPIAEEFTVSGFQTLLEGELEGEDAPFNVCLDTDRFPTVTYVTTGGYYQSEAIAGALQSLCWEIKSMAMIDLHDDPITLSTFGDFQNKLTLLNSEIAAKAKGACFVGADTYVIAGSRVVMPDSYGYLSKLASNLSQAIPAWVPVANNPQGVVSAVATTRQVDRALRLKANEEKFGPSFNPIVFKQNVGYTIMGNRTTYPADGILGPTSFLNCQLVVNSVLRSARRAASDLLIVSTNPNTAFNMFKMAIGRTCDRMLVNGDGLAAYTIKKLKKTQPATIDIAINLTVVEGIEVFNIQLSYQIALD